ncbi:MAG: hypothetical protein IPM46_00370 [Flavobacteriales bacterium]|nr:hypothetical protein [Flavobacteriales bacterium]
MAAFQSTGRGAAEFDAWMQGMDKLVQGARKQNVQAFITTCAGLFREGALLKSASVTWKARSKDFAFAFDSVPKITFAKTDLLCLAKGDSSVILNTGGTYLPTQEIWMGNGGKVTWARAGLKPTATYAEWDHAYSVRLKSAAFEVICWSVQRPYFPKTLVGKLAADKLLANVDEGSASDPRFESYDRRIGRSEIVEGIDFEGGFSMQGASCRATAPRKSRRTSLSYPDKRPSHRHQRPALQHRPRRITSDEVALRVHGTDSLLQQSASLRFLRDKRQLSLIEKDQGRGKAPFYNTQSPARYVLRGAHLEAGRPVGAARQPRRHQPGTRPASRASTTSATSATWACSASIAPSARAPQRFQQAERRALHVRRVRGVQQDAEDHRGAPAHRPAQQGLPLLRSRRPNGCRCSRGSGSTSSTMPASRTTTRCSSTARWMTT